MCSALDTAAWTGDTAGHCSRRTLHNWAAMIRPHLCRFRAKSGRIRANAPQSLSSGVAIDRLRPNFGQIQPGLDQILAISTGVGPTWATIGLHSDNSHYPDCVTPIEQLSVEPMHPRTPPCANEPKSAPKAHRRRRRGSPLRRRLRLQPERQNWRACTSGLHGKVKTSYHTKHRPLPPRRVSCSPARAHTGGRCDFK